jgi:hypothetical protein
MAVRPRTSKRSAPEPACHHHVYVVLLEDCVRDYRRVRVLNPNADPAKPCLYVGMTGLPPIERFWNHKDGHKASWYVCKHGIKLLPELFAYLNPMPYAAAAQMERDLAVDLRTQGYTVCGGT